MAETPVAQGAEVEEAALHLGLQCLEQRPHRLPLLRVNVHRQFLRPLEDFARLLWAQEFEGRIPFRLFLPSEIEAPCSG